LRGFINFHKLPLNQLLNSIISSGFFRLAQKNPLQKFDLIRCLKLNQEIKKEGHLPSLLTLTLMFLNDPVKYGSYTPNPVVQD